MMIHGYEGDSEKLTAVYITDQARNIFNQRFEIRPHGECKTCKHYVKGGLDGKTYVCEHPNIEQDDYYNYAFLAVEENDFCSSYEKKDGD